MDEQKVAWEVEAVAKALYEFDNSHLVRLFDYKLPEYGSPEMHGINHYRLMANAALDAIRDHIVWE